MFFHSRAQERAVRASLEALEQSGRHERPIATEIAAASTFHPAEEYHQQYLAKRGRTTCAVRPPAS